jgi:hypothetical protein
MWFPSFWRLSLGSPTGQPISVTLASRHVERLRRLRMFLITCLETRFTSPLNA